MARGGAADGDPRGGERATPARARTRLATAAAATAAAGGVAIYGAVEADRARSALLALGVASIVTLVAGLLRPLPGALPPALLGLGAEWTLAAWSRGAGAPGGTAFVAAGIFVAAELAYWSLEQVSVADEPELAARRAGGLAVRAVLAFALGAVVLAALELRAGSGVVLEAVGVGAAVGLLALVFALARPESSGR